MGQDGSLPSLEDLGGHRKWSLCGDFKVCTACFCGILGISRNKLGRFKKWVVAGHLEPVSIAKSDKPSVQLRDHPQYRHADSWLGHCYAHVAEHRADSLIPGSEQVEDPTKEILPELADPALGLPLAMPCHLHIQADNTCREMRYQQGMLWMASLIRKSAFKSATTGFMQVGHTHIDVDQRWARERGVRYI
jgi:hypothetical protein